MRRYAAVAALAILLTAWSGVTWAQQVPQVLHNQVRPEIARGAARLVGSLPTTQQMNLSIVLPLRNEDDLKSLLVRLYDPSSPDYRHFLSVDEFTARYGPTADDYQAVVAWAQANDLTVTGTPANRMIVPVRGTVNDVQRAFNVRMNTYQHPTENRTFFSPDRQPSINLSVPVAGVSGLDNLSIPRPMVVPPQPTALRASSLAALAGSGPGGNYLASDMRAAYYGGSTLDGTGQTVGLLEFDGYYPSDVTQTFASVGQSYNVPVNNVLLDGMPGGPVTQIPNAEPEVVLDIVQAIGMAPGLGQVRVYIGQSDVDILNSMASENIAKQISSSWFWGDNTSLDDPFFQEFAAQGQSFFQASGDSGAYVLPIGYVYPAVDDYVTAVGGTTLVTNGAGGPWESEGAWSSSGGGVSPNSPLPAWQIGLANASNGGSATLRNVPDVAMEANWDNYVCTYGACGGGWAGTSFAAPRWAGFMALINQQAIETGNAPQGGLGFINPALYELAEGPAYNDDLHDISTNNNDCCGQTTWYNSVAGYDLVTGWGSPTGANLIDDLAGPQIPGFWLHSSLPSIQVAPGSSSATTISIIEAGGFTGNVSLAASSALPTGVTASWGTNPASGSSILTLTAASNAPSASTNLTITGTAGGFTATSTIPLSVHTPTFLLTANPIPVGITPGSTATSTIAVTPQFGFTGSIRLSVSGLPNGVTGSFSPTSTTGTSILTLTTSSSVTGGISTLTIKGTSGSLTATTTITLTVQAPFFKLATNAGSSVWQGTSVSMGVSITSMYGFNGNVALSVSGLPSGVTASFSPNPTTSYSDVTFTATATAPLTSVTATINGTSGMLSASTTFTFSVIPSTFGIVQPADMSLVQGGSGTTTVSAVALGFSGYVNLSLSGLPNGVTAAFAQNPIYVSNFGIPSTQLTLTAASTAIPGQNKLTVTGTSGSITSSNTFTLAITPPVNTPVPAVDLGAVNLSRTSSTPTAITFNFAATESVRSTEVVTQGSQGLDFSNAGGGTCDTNGSSHVYTAGNSCTVNVNFSPLYAGARYGAARLLDTSGNILATTLLYGSGSGPQLVFPSNTTLTTLGGGLLSPAAPAVDAKGNVYVSDSGTVKEIPAGCTSASCVITLGGGFITPRGLAVDGSGNVYVGDTGNATVGEIPSGCVSSSCVITLGGGFNSPGYVDVDGGGNIYVSDYSNSVFNGAVKEIPLGCTLASCVTTLANVQYPGGVVVDGYGNVYAYDGNIHQIQSVRCISNCKTGPMNTFSPILSVDGSGNLYFGAAVDGSGNTYTTSNGAVQRQNLAAPPSLSFAATNAGLQSSDSPKTVTLRNIGNSGLTFAVPGTGTNPSISANFTLDGSTTCPEVTPSSSAGTLAASASCNLAVDFIPATGGSITGSVVLTDNNMNVANATQNLGLSGAGISATPLTPWIQVNNGAWQQLSTITVSPGSTVNLGEQVLTGGSYSWTGPGGYSSTARIASGIPLNSVTNVFNLTYTNLSGASSTATFTVSVGNTPLTPWIQANNGGWQQISTVTVSPGSTVNLGEQVLTGGSYSWTGPGGYSSTSRIASNVPLNSASNIFTLTYTNTVGATSTATFTVSVGSTPLTPWIQVSDGGWQQTNSVTVSPGSTVNLGEQVLTGGSYSWTGPGGYSSTSRIASNVPLNSASNIFTLTYTNTVGATSTATFTVSVGSTPLTPWVQVNNGGWQQISTVTVSPGSTVNLGEQVLTGGSYSWSGPGGYTSTSRIASNVPLNSTTNVFTLTYTNAAGATSSATFTINVGSTPLTPWIQVNNGGWQQVSTVTVNAGSTVNLGEQVLTGGSYSWTGPGGYTSASRIASNIPLNSATNVYTLTYTNTAGASSTVTFTVTIR